MKVSRSTGRFFGVVGVALAACTISSAAYAAWNSGPHTNMGTINSRTYENWAILINNDYPDAMGGANVQTVGTAIAPAGHLAAQGSLWLSNGYLCRDTEWVTNSSSAGSLAHWTYTGDCGPSYYWGDGQVGVWKPGTGTWAYGYPINTATYYHS